MERCEHPRSRVGRRLKLAAVAATGLALAHGGAWAQAPLIDTTGDVSAELLARATAYEHGEGVPKDPQKAIDLYCVAARAGNADAQYNLGWMYANGRGVTRDDAVAASFFALSAEQGNAYARRMLDQVGEARGVLPECMNAPERVPSLPALEEPNPFADLPPHQQRIADMVMRIAPSYGIDPRLALAVIAVESNFEPKARSVKDARGLMQLIPQTATRFRVKNPFDATDNVRGGLAYLRWLLAYYEGRVAFAAAAYNAGEAAVDRYGGVPPYPETRDYVKRVQRYFGSEIHPFDAGVVAPSPMLSTTDSRPM